jgi:hypothetical protein
MGMTRAEREQLIQQYAEGPAKLSAALAEVPADAVQWRPAPGAWSAHEIIVHCGDSETASASRIRQLIADPAPLIVGYDQDAWATLLDYHAHPLEPALAAVDAARANTVALLRHMPDEIWERQGRHSDSGAYSAEDWLRVYAAHLTEHSDQLAGNVAAFVGNSRRVL